MRQTENEINQITVESFYEGSEAIAEAAPEYSEDAADSEEIAPDQETTDAPAEAAQAGEADAQQSPLTYGKLCYPVLLFPLLYFPYTLWWRPGFAALATEIILGSETEFLQLMLTGNNTILLFWCVITLVVMLASAVLAMLRIRRWYARLLYLAVMFSLCGICSLFLYTVIIG